MSVLKKTLMTVFVFHLLITFNNAQQKGLKVNKKNVSSLYFKSSAFFKCNIKFPENYNPDKKYQLVIGLHGGGSSLENFVNIWNKQKKIEFIYIVPQAPYAWLLGKYIGYDWALWPSKNSYYINKATDLIHKYISDITSTIKKKYNISDVYLLGFSQGAIFTYITGITDHHLYKGLICLSGPGLLEPLTPPFGGEIRNWLSETQIKKAKELKVFIAHGTDDKRVEYRLGLKSKKVLSSYDFDVTFQSFKGRHKIEDAILNEVIDWLKKNK